jgi:hypothetical protein
MARVESSGLGHTGDQLHFGAEAARERGRRYAEVMLRLWSEASVERAR